MVKFRLSILPKADRFFFLLHQSTLNIQKTALAIQDLIGNLDNVEAKAAEIKELEEFGDQIIHDITRSLHRTFVTPIDREDILALASRLDDVIDAMDEAAQYVFEYKIKTPTDHALLLSQIIVDCANALEKAVNLLSAKGSRLKEILPISAEINRLENKADRALSHAMGELFNSDFEVVEILKWRDIYHNMEEATDRAEDASDVLEGIVLKHA